MNPAFRKDFLPISLGAPQSCPQIPWMPFRLPFPDTTRLLTAESL